ncbi:hypothetical protein GCK32_022225, partial [Trichostrongylus colubriformis]
MFLIRRFRRRSFFRLLSSFYPVAFIVFLIWGESLCYYYSRLFWKVPQPEFDKA